MPLTPSQTRALLERLGHRPRQALGQNFLVDGNIVQKSLALAEVCPGDRVVEVGPGLGTLTEALLNAGAEVWAVELDPGLSQHLTESLVHERLHLLQADAVDEPRAGLAAGPFKIVANLPYAIATPWLERILAGPLPEVLVLMLQRECAERFCAVSGSKQFGAVSVFLEAAYLRQPGHAVARNCFYPVPDVDSVLLHLRRRSQPHQFAAPTRRLIRELFTQRRKQIGSLARKRFKDFPALESWLADFPQHGLMTTARPEAVPTDVWVKLDMALRA